MKTIKLIYAFSFLVAYIVLFPYHVNAQQICGTPSHSNYSSYNQLIQTMADEEGPLYLKIYVHVIRDYDSTGGQSNQRVRQALAILDRDFNQHNIFFVWDCSINYINDSVLFKPIIAEDTLCFLIGRHSDGIDIYFFPDAPDNHLTGWGAAEDIGATALLVAGNLSNWPPIPPPYIPLVPSHTTSHEMGHCLNLWHTWEGPNNCQEFVDGTNCDTCGDLICDSPAEPPNGISYAADIETCTWDLLIEDPNHDFYNPDEHNMMTYVHPYCLEYFTPMQAQRMRNSIATLPILQPCRVYYNDTQITGPNEVWNTPLSVSGNLIIEQGAKLTINNVVINFEPYSKVIVKTGGKLIVNNSTLTNSSGFCNSQRQWQGIEVWGDKTKHQFPVNGLYYQGYVELHNSTISNAKCAVELWKPGDYNTTGGIIKAYESQFINNAQSVHALYYRNHHPGNPLGELPYQSYFSNCNFIVNNQYIPNFIFESHINIDHIKSFDLYGCNYSAIPSTSDNGIAEENSAIESNSAGFSVHSPCLSAYIPCTLYDTSLFTGLFYGIKAFSDHTNNYTYYVENASMKNVKYGVYATDFRNPVVQNCNFQLNAPSTIGCPGIGCGIHFEGCSGFRITNNTFAKFYSGTSGEYTGILIKDAHSIDDIYKNTFVGMSYGNFAIGDNVFNTQVPREGLTYTCNNNLNNDADFYVPFGNENFIQNKQGDITKASGNTFSLNNNSTWHFYFGGDYDIDYYYYPVVSETPTKYNNHLLVHGNAASNTCPSGNTGISIENQELQYLVNKFSESNAQLENVQVLYNTLIDGGSTSEKLEDISNAQSDDMWLLREELLGLSPHLSAEVLRAVADKTDVFTEAAIFDILAANPDELKNNELITYLEQKEIPLPAYMIEILRQVAAGTTYKTLLQQQIASLSHSRADAANNILIHYLNYSITDNALIRNWYDNWGGVQADYSIIANYVHIGNTASALSLAGIMPQLYNFSTTETYEHNLYLQLLDFQTNLALSGRNMAQLNESEKLFLYEMLNQSSGLSARIAKGILSAYYGGSFCTCYSSNPDSLKHKEIKPIEKTFLDILTVSVKPNPANDWIAIDYILPEGKNETYISICDFTGRTFYNDHINGIQGQKLIDLRQLSIGTYFLIIDSGNIKKSIKLIKSDR